MVQVWNTHAPPFTIFLETEFSFTAYYVDTRRYENKKIGNF